MTCRVDLNRATCHAILTTIANYGFPVQYPKTRAYRLDPSIIAAGNAAFAQFPVLEYASPEQESMRGDLKPGFDYRDVPVIRFVAGSLDSPITGVRVEEIAGRMIAPAKCVARLASGGERFG